MTNPTTPVQATFPVPPPLPNLPFVTLDPAGQFILTPQAFSFLQAMWAAIQGTGGVIDGVTDVALGVGAINANVLALLSGQGAALTLLVPPQNPAALLQSFFSTITLNEVPAGVTNGVNVTFTLAFPPTAQGIELSVNGLQQKPTVDYTLAGSTITMIIPPLATDLLLANYNH